MKYRKVTYRNGKNGKLLCDDRKETVFCILTMEGKYDSIHHHLEDGTCNIGGPESPWDIIEYETVG